MNLGIWIILVGPLFATGLDSQLIRRLSLATTPKDLQQAQEQAEKIRETRLACRIQLAERRVPDACYGAQKLERTFGLRVHSSTVNQLDEICRSSAQLLTTIPRVNLDILSRTCRTEILKALDLLAYKLDSLE